MRLSIDHQTGFRYATPVKSSYNEARMTPATTEHQTVWSSRVAVVPQAWSFSYTDYWGSTVTTFEVHDVHERLTVHAQAVVETFGDNTPWDTERQVAESDLGWAALDDRAVIDTMTEFLTTAARTEAPAKLAEKVAPLRQHPPRLAALEVCALVADHLTYRRGSTTVNSTAAEVWDKGEGVCQDFSHLALAGLRALGIPARYVSGYLYPDDASGVNTAVRGESHSWIEWWCGTWVSYDPTFARRISDRYVRVGHGRDYGDVSPLRGTYAGGESEMFVTVELTELS